MVRDAFGIVGHPHDLFRVQHAATRLSSFPLANKLRVKRGDGSEGAGVFRRRLLVVSHILVGSFARPLLTALAVSSLVTGVPVVCPCGAGFVTAAFLSGPKPLLTALLAVRLLLSLPPA